MLDRDKYWDCLDQAMEASGRGRVDEALAWLDEAVRQNPHGHEAHNIRGELLWDDGRVEQALEEFGRSTELSSECHTAHLNRIEILIEEFQDHEGALARADDLLASPLEPQAEAEVYYLKAKALFYLEDLEGALFLLRRAIKTFGEVGIYRGFEGQILFELGYLDESLRTLERALVLEPDCAHSLYHLGLVAEHRARPEEADRLFAQAASMAPESYPLPVRIDSAEFEEAAASALDRLPKDVRKYLGNCPVVIEDLPSEDLFRAEGVSPQTLGLFTGIPATEPGMNPAHGTEARVDLDRILIFKRNLERIAGSREELVEQIEITVKHEIGHYLGMDEAEIERLGLA